MKQLRCRNSMMTFSPFAGASLPVIIRFAYEERRKFVLDLREAFFVKAVSGWPYLHTPAMDLPGGARPITAARMASLSGARREYDMDTVFIQRHVAGVGVARLCLGRPVRAPRTPLSRSSEVPVRFALGQCFGVLWWMAGVGDVGTRLLAIGRATERPASGLLLPGFSRPVEIRVLLEQAGPPGDAGPMSPYLEAAEEASLLGKPLPPLSIACYRRLPPRLAVSETTLARLHEVFDYPVDQLPGELADSVRRLTAGRPNPRERRWHPNGSRCPVPASRRLRAGAAPGV
jgi:hypothetical protein